MLKRLLAGTDFLQTVELWPPGFSSGSGPHSLEDQFSWLCERLEILGEYFDAFHVADLNTPSRRYLDSVLTAVQLRQRFRWLELAPTVCARDRNRKALEEAISSALFFGMDNIILVRGDPFPSGPKRMPRNVYDVAGVSGLVRLARRVQKSIGLDELCLLSPIDLTRIGDESYLEVVKDRERATSDVFLSQIFTGEPEDYLLLVDRLRSEGIRSPVLHNVFPFLSFDDAAKLSRRFGFKVPRAFLSELKESGASAGIRSASRFRDALESNRGKVNGVFVSSRGEPELALRLAR